MLAALEVVHGHDPAEKQALLRALPPATALPASEADLLLGGDSTEARRALAAGLGDVLQEDALADLALVVTELLVNAGRYAGGGTARIWVAADHVVVAVTDGGPGPAQASAGLRTVGAALGGRGLWIVHQLCDAVDFVVTATDHTVIARYPR